MTARSRSEPLVGLYASGAGNRGGTGVYIQRLIDGFRRTGADWVVPLGAGMRGTLSRAFMEFAVLPVSSGRFRLMHLPSFAGAVPRGVGSVVTVHDLAFLARPRWFPALRGAYYRAVFPAMARRARMVIADSDFTADEAVRLLGIPRERIRRVYLSHGNPCAGGLPDFPGAWGIPGEYGICACTVEPRKNIPTLLRAWRMLVSRRPGAVLVMAGRWGWEDASLKNELEGCPGVVLTGPLSREMLDAAVSRARFMVYPSLYEGFGLPPLEAAALGVPSVLGPASALREVYGRVGLFPDDNPEAYCEAMTELLENPRDPRVLRDFASPFTDEAMAAATAAVYRECME
jgi:glycosyltransferase involved in cell wall biosynthesis